MKIEVDVRGMEDVRRVLGEIGPREAKNLMRATIMDVAKGLADESRAVKTPDTGLLHRMTTHRRQRGTPSVLRSSVVVGRRAFYWRFLEYGQGPDKVEHAMFGSALRRVGGELQQRFLDSFTRKLVSRMARAARRAARG